MVQGPEQGHAEHLRWSDVADRSKDEPKVPVHQFQPAVDAEFPARRLGALGSGLLQKLCSH